MAYNYNVGFMRRFGSVITYLSWFDPVDICFCGYLLAPKPYGLVKKEKKCRKYQGKF